MNKILNFKVGDVVQLPSENKLMTVESVKGDTVQCVWLDPNHMVIYHEFSAAVLIPPHTGSCSNKPENYLMEN